MARSPFAKAQASYQNVDLQTRAAGATPHQLIAMLFEEALNAIDTLSAAAARKDFARAAQSQARALSIIGGLQASLDMERGGDLAQNLADVYREASRLIMASGKSNEPMFAQQARSMLAEIASAWSAIG
ncbi:flagellar export chaperone FliS [Sphingoaurantiacus capsulatus]|uniref:Flagellar secretion chaperone FliS n=1 Tax=Sphingoaurantiacus capsulatus TaxID=1771310 RepID=A0ABV7XGR1_9SPHN